MKKALLTLAVAFMVMAIGAQAQDNNNYKWVVGGTGHFNQSIDKTGDDVTNKLREYRIEPFVGYNINDRWRVGLTYGFSLDHRYELDATGTLADIGTKRTYRVGPYVHFNIVRYKRWILFAEAEALFGYSPRYMNPGPGATPGVGGAPAAPGAGAYDAKLQSFDLTIKPGISYELDKHVNIDFNFNLLGWVYSNRKETRLDNGVVYSNSSNGLQLDLLENSIDEYWRNITIGVTFKF